MAKSSHILGLDGKPLELPEIKPPVFISQELWEFTDPETLERGTIHIVVEHPPKPLPKDTA